MTMWELSYKKLGLSCVKLSVVLRNIPGVSKISILKTRLKNAVKLKTARFNLNFSFNPMPSMH